MAAPGAEYARRLAEAEAEVVAGRRQDDRVVAARAAILVTAAIVAWLAFGRAVLSPWWLCVPGVAFGALILVHDRVIAARARGERLVAYYRTALERLAGRWIGVGATGERFLVADHPYAADLDCFGNGSLFQLLCAARTADGEQTLAGWLLAPAPHDEIVARQAAVAELRGRVDLRQALALAGDDVRAAIDTGWLSRWGAQAVTAPAIGLRVLVGLVPLLPLLALAAGPKVLLAALAVHGAVGFAFRSRTAALVATIERPARELKTLARLLAVIEGARFESPRLQALSAALAVEGRPPSAQIDRLHRLVTLLDARRNQMFIPFAALLLWTTQLGLALAAWRAACGPAIARWVAAAGELEALLSLARHAYEHPTDVLPELLDAGPCCDAVAIGHPLLAEDRAVRNDVTLDAAHRLLVVSGSNMSGKSTLLRTLGANVVLALAGGTVRAQRLRLSSLAIGASIRVADSLLDGRSRFYAEILRLRDVVELAAAGPVLFLLDEILHGTNSHDRRIGADAVVRALLARGAVGLVTTHDLALATLADTLAPAAANVHFEDHLEGDQLRFDYRMRPGVVTRSNALALMRAVGIDV